jgi:hypothetical protein
MDTYDYRSRLPGHAPMRSRSEGYERPASGSHSGRHAPGEASATDEAFDDNYCEMCGTRTGQH